MSLNTQDLTSIAYQLPHGNKLEVFASGERVIIVDTQPQQCHADADRFTEPDGIHLTISREQAQALAHALSRVLCFASYLKTDREV